MRNLESYYDRFLKLSDENLLHRINKKESFHKESVVAAYHILIKRGYELEHPFQNGFEVRATKKEIYRTTQKNASKNDDLIKFKKNYSKVSIGKICLFFIIFFPLVHLSNHYFNDTLFYRKIHLLTDTVVGLGSITYLFELTIFSIIFFRSSNARKDLFRTNSHKTYSAIKVFITSLLLITIWELLFSDKVVIYQSFTENSYRTYLKNLWYGSLIAFNEELIFKWLLLTQILLRVGNKKSHRIFAYLFVAVLFSLSHIPTQLAKFETVQYGHIIMTFLYSYFTSILYVRHRNFLLVVLLHFFLNISIVFVEGGSNFYFNWGLVLIGMYTIPSISKSWLFKPSKRIFPDPTIVFFCILFLATFLTPLIPKATLDHYNISQQLYFLNRDHEALAIANASIAGTKNNKLFFNHRGNVFYDLGKYDSSWADYNRAINLDPKYYAAIRNRGLAARKLKYYSDCIMDLTVAIEQGLLSSRVYQNRGSCYLEINELESTKADFIKSLSLNPLNESAYYGLGKIHLLLKEYDSTIFYMNKTLSIDPDFIPSMEVMAVAYSALSKYDTSNTIMTKAIEMGSSSPIRFYVRGINYFRKEDYFNAVKEFEKSIELIPTNSELFLNLGYSYLFLENFKKGCEYLSISADKGNEEAIANLKVYCDNARNESNDKMRN